MSEIKKNAWVFLLWSTIAGKISFFIGAVIMSMVYVHVGLFSFMFPALAGGIGGLILGIFLNKYHEIGKMTVVGMTAVPIGYLSPIYWRSAMDLFWIRDEDLILFMGLICGAISGAIIYGRKSIGLFSVIGGLITFLFGILVRLFNSSHPIKRTLANLLDVFGSIDLNFLVIITSFGLGIGLSIGLYEMLRHKQTR